MEIPTQLLIFAGSLIAIFLLAGLASWLKLGSAPTLSSEADAAMAAGEVIDGFNPVETAIDTGGAAALLRDRDGQIMLIKRHGNRFAGRLLTDKAHARLWQDRGQNSIEVDCTERTFGKVFLDIENPDVWAEAINGVNRADHA